MRLLQFLRILVTLRVETPLTTISIMEARGLISLRDGVQELGFKLIALGLSNLRVRGVRRSRCDGLGAGRSVHGCSG